MSTPLFLRYKLLQKYFQEYTYALAYIWYMLAKLLHVDMGTHVHYTHTHKFFHPFSHRAVYGLPGSCPDFPLTLMRRCRLIRKPMSWAAGVTGGSKGEKTREAMVTEEQLIIWLTKVWLFFPRLPTLSPRKGHVLAALEGVGGRAWEQGKGGEEGSRRKWWGVAPTSVLPFPLHQTSSVPRAIWLASWNGSKFLEFSMSMALFSLQWTLYWSQIECLHFRKFVCWPRGHKRSPTRMSPPWYLAQDTVTSTHSGHCFLPPFIPWTNIYWPRDAVLSSSASSSHLIL